MAGEKVGRAHLRVDFRINAAGAHEIERFGQVTGELLITFRLWRVLYEGQHPLMRVRQVRVSAGRERTQEVQGRRGLPIGLELPARVGRARLRGEIGAVDDVAAISRQLLAVALLGRRTPRLGELPGDAPDLHYR